MLASQVGMWNQGSTKLQMKKHTEGIDVLQKHQSLIKAP
jgi:hypothetical protein